MSAIKARSRSDLGLAEWVRQETGIQVSPWQLERWRRAGLIQPAGHSYAGSGSAATYSPEARRQAAEVSRLSTHYRKTHELVRVAFYHGLYVREDALRRSLDSFLVRMESWTGPAETDDDLDRIDHLAQRFAAMAERTKQGRGLKRRVRGRDESPEAIAAGVYYTLLYAIRKGSLTTQDGLTDLLDATGISGLLGDQVAGIGPVAPGGRKDIARFLRQATLPNVRVLLACASMADLEESRELIRLCFAFFKSIGSLVSRWFDLPSALGFAYLVLAAGLFGAVAA